MAHGGQVTDPALLGVLPLQHHDAEFEPHHRIVLRCGRVQKGARYDRDEVTQVVEGSYGDVLGTLLWEQEGSERRSPGWGLGGLAAAVTSAPSDPSAGGTPAEKASKRRGGRTKPRGKSRKASEVHPLRGAGSADTRFRGKAPAGPKWSQRFPVGWPGWLAAGTEERAQAEVFLPAFSGLVAPDRYGVPDLGTRVYDLTTESRIDEERWAHLQTLVSVLPGSGGAPSQLGLQLGSTNLDGVPGNLGVIDHDVDCVGQLKAPRGVFLLDTGRPGEGSSCKHAGGGDADGNRYKPPHLDANHTFFFVGGGGPAFLVGGGGGFGQSGGGDGPLKFDPSTWQRTERDKGVWKEAYLRWKAIGEQHDWGGATYPGKWAIQYTDHWYVPKGSGHPPPEEPPRLPPPEDPEDGKPQPPKGGDPPPGGQGGSGTLVGGGSPPAGGPTPPPGSPPPPSGSGTLGPPDPPELEPLDELIPGLLGDPPGSFEDPDEPEEQGQPLVCQDASYEREYPHSTAPVVVPGIGFRGSAWAAGEPDATAGFFDDETQALVDAAPYGPWLTPLVASSSTGLAGSWEGISNGTSGELVNQTHKRSNSALILHPYGVKLNTLMTSMATALAGCPVVATFLLPPVISSLAFGSPRPEAGTPTGSAVTSGAKIEQDSVGGSVRIYSVDSSGAPSGRLEFTGDDVRVMSGGAGALGLPAVPAPGAPTGFSGHYIYSDTGDGHAYAHLDGGSAARIDTPTLGSLTNVADGEDTPSANEVLAYNGSAWEGTTSLTLTGLTVNGKLTVTGLIDPTGVVITDGAQPYSGTESCLWANGEACPSWWDGVATSTSYRIPIMSTSGANRTLIGVTGGSGSVLSIKATTHATQGVVNVLADSADTNSVRELARLTHRTSGTVAAGFGGRLTTYLENDGGVTELAAAVDVLWTDATATSEDADMVWSLDVGSTLTERLRLTSTGYLRLAAGALELTAVTAPGAPGAGLGRLYHDTADSKLYWHPNGGSATDLTAGAAHALLSATHTDTTAASVVRGDLIVGKAGPVWERLAIGAANRALVSDGTDAAWAQLDHGAGLAGLADDDHTQYALLAGRSGGQTLIGGTGSGDDLVLRSTSHATQGTVDVLHSSATTNAVVEAFRVRALSTGTVANNFGVQQTWTAESAGGTERDAHALRVLWDNSTNGNELAQVQWQYMSAGALATYLLVQNDINYSGLPLRFAGAETKDVGATGTGRPRDIYMAGAVKEGAWQATAVAAAYGGTGQSSYTKGDLLAASAATTLTKLGVGTDGQVLTAASAEATGVKWADAAAATDHGGLTGLTDDDHTQYALLAGRSGGQTIFGGTGPSENLILSSTSDNTEGLIVALSASADTNAVREILQVKHLSSGTVAAGFGARIGFTLEDASNNQDEAGSLDVVWTDATDGSEDAAFSVRLAVAGTVAERFRVTGANVTVGVWQASAVGVAYGGTGLTTFTAAGAIPYATAATTLAALAIGSADTLLYSTGSAPAWGTVSSRLDAIGSTRGSLLYRGASGWAALTPGTDGHVLTSNGAGADPAWEAATGGAGSCVRLTDEKSSGTNGGTFTSGSWQTRTLNTEYDPDGVCTLASNQFTLSAGTYRIWAFAPGFNCDQHQARLYNVTDTSLILTGSSMYTRADGTTATTHSVICGEFTIGASKALEIQHRCTTTGTTSGFGAADSYGTEVYTTVLLIKIA